MIYADPTTFGVVDDVETDTGPAWSRYDHGEAIPTVSSRYRLTDGRTIRVERVVVVAGRFGGLTGTVEGSDVRVTFRRPILEAALRRGTLADSVDMIRAAGR